MTDNIGHQHTLRWVGWNPDRDLNPHYADLPDVDEYGVLVEHVRPDNGEPCIGGFAVIDSPVSRRINPNAPKWTLVEREPLTLEPSLLCGACGDHGWIKQGRWWPA